MPVSIADKMMRVEKNPQESKGFKSPKEFVVCRLPFIAQQWVQNGEIANTKLTR